MTSCKPVKKKLPRKGSNLVVCEDIIMVSTMVRNLEKCCICKSPILALLGSAEERGHDEAGLSARGGLVRSKQRQEVNRF